MDKESVVDYAAVLGCRQEDVRFLEHGYEVSEGGTRLVWHGRIRVFLILNWGTPVMFLSIVTDVFLFFVYLLFYRPLFSVMTT